MPLTRIRRLAALALAALVLALAAPWNNAAVGATSSGPDANGVTVTIDTAPSPDAVTVTIPAPNTQAGKLFGRLKASQLEKIQP